jgi:ABC-type sulfate/molybdate transport systems ATPase subunit
MTRSLVVTILALAGNVAFALRVRVERLLARVRLDGLGERRPSQLSGGQTHTATVLVTHDREDAFAIADRVVVLQEGRVAQSATPRELEARPASPWVAHFLGNGAAPRS